MTEQSWARLKAFVADTLRVPEAERPTYLTTRCQDSQLRAEVERLLDGVSGLFDAAGAVSATSDPNSPSDALIKPDVETHADHAVSSGWPNRFRLIRRVGSGGFGDVYRVTDTRGGGDVALKILRRVTPTSLYHFKREFRALAAIRHEHLVGLYELINEAGAWMFTMEFIDGVHFSDAFGPRPDPEQVRSSLVQLVAAVMALHGHGFLHRDLKPSNVLVTPTGRLVLVDFGLIRELQTWNPQSVTLAGTPIYMAPEQVKRGELSEAADWYAVGVMVYHVLTGRLPFEGDLLDVLFGKLTRPAVSPAQIVPDVPSDLDAICTGLLRSDPADRLTGRDVLALMNRQGTRGLAAVAAPAPQGGARPSFVGRRAELAIAREAFELSRQGHPQVLHVSGISGIGKSAFVAETLRSALRSDPRLLILSGRCHQTESVPYQGIDEVVDALSRHLSSMPTADLDAVLPRDFASLARVFPVLAKPASVTTSGSLESADPVQSRIRAFLALRELLGRLAERHPVIVAIDDFQWADLDVVAFVRDLMSPPVVPPLLLVLAYRADEAESSARLGSVRALPQTLPDYPRTRVIDLTGLQPDDAQTLIESLVPDGSRDAALVSAIVAEAAGSPFFAHELAQGAAGRGTLERGAVTIQGVIAVRVQDLDDVEREYLKCVSVAGRPTRVTVIDTAAALRSTPLLRSNLVAKRLLRVLSSGETLEVETYHDRIREAILSGLTEAERRDLHGRLADALETNQDLDPERLAVHHERAGRAATAAGYAVIAARRATAALAFNNAAHWYRYVLAHGAMADDERRAMHTELADVLSSAGRGAESAVEYVHAADRSAGPAKTQLLSRAANQYLRAGHLREGVELMEGVLELVGISVPENRQRLLWRIGRERALWWVAKWRRPRAVAAATGEAVYREVDVCAAATIGFSMVDPLRSAFFASRYVRLALSLGEPYRLCLALASQATQLSHTLGADTRHEVDGLLDRAATIAARIDHPHGRAFVMVMRGIVAYLRGEWALASQQSDAALEVLQSACTGVAWEVCTAHTIGLVSRCATGEWAQNAAVMPALIREAETRGDRYAQHSLRVLGNGYVISLAADDPARALRDLTDDIEAWSSRYFDLQRASAMIAEVDIALYEGDADRASRTLDVKWPALAASRLLRLPDTFVFAHMARGRTALAHAAASRDDRREAHLSAARAAAHQLRKHGPSWASGLAALLEGGAAVCEGEITAAEEGLKSAETALSAVGLTPYLMAVRWRLAALRSPGGVGRDPSVERWIRDQNIKRPDNVFDALLPGVERGSHRP